jgi:hypothetical protein
MMQDVTQRLRALYVETGDATCIEAAETIAALREYRDAATLSNARLRVQIKDIESRLMLSLSESADKFSTTDGDDDDGKGTDEGTPNCGTAQERTERR